MAKGKESLTQYSGFGRPKSCPKDSEDLTRRFPAPMICKVPSRSHIASTSETPQDMIGFSSCRNTRLSLSARRQTTVGKTPKSPSCVACPPTIVILSSASQAGAWHVLDILTEKSFRITVSPAEENLLCPRGKEEKLCTHCAIVQSTDFSMLTRARDMHMSVSG